MSDDPQFGHWIERARKITVKVELQRRGLWVRGLERDAGVPCPGCGGRDRFAVNQRKNVWTCRKSGGGGDAIALAMHIDGTTFVQAVETIVGEPPPARGTTESEVERAARLRRLEAEERARRVKREKDEAAAEKFREWERKAAWTLWVGAHPLAGTIGAAYLARRGLVAPPEAKLRFHPNVPYYAAVEHDTRERHVKPVHAGPCVVAAIQAADGHFIGVQRKWIDLATADGKLQLVDPQTGKTWPSKKTKGTKRGGTIRLAGHASDPREASMATVFYLGEGIETVLSVHHVLTPEERVGAEFHAGVDLGNIAGKAAGRVLHPTARDVDKAGRSRKRMVPDDVPDPEDDTALIGIPASVRRLVLLGDGDSEPFFTDLAMRRAARRFARAYPHLEIAIVMARPGADFNAMLTEAA